MRFYKAFIEILKNITECFIKYDIVKLRGNTDFFRLRIGKYRAVFEIKKIIVINIDSRGGIYK
ncbi:type II toxin-antitoxin system RelE/ParE family toxin [Sebaldella sp. S0638]|uniref:type II toxin-antitoxin system RelE family toxin n=1 Tax=Sebaldella sp. S0638 TaxID=2957809 RepID=UPI00209F5CDF|nr:hypothetical protein [Sebaldella sp. S0638]MCP1224243.1 hypothetical protein [Sebaldella sp. S0638]